MDRYFGCDRTLTENCYTPKIFTVTNDGFDMDRLNDVSLEELHEQLDETDGNVPTQRVLAAIGRKQGARLDELAERHNIAEKTVRNWLDRFAEEPLAEAPYDDDRSGRPAKLSSEEKEKLFEELHQPPIDLAYDREAWDPGLVQSHVAKKYDVDYSLRHIYRLMDEADLGRPMAGPRPYRASQKKEAESGETDQTNPDD